MRHIAARTACLAVLSAIALGGCIMPGMKRDTSGLGQTPIGLHAEQMSFISDAAFNQRATAEWFSKQCPAGTAAEATACAQRLGMTCPPQDPDAAAALCDYTGTYRQQAVMFAGTPSLASSPQSQWQTTRIRMQLVFDPQSGARIDFEQGPITNPSE